MLSQTYLINLRNQQSTIIKEHLVLVTPKLYRLVKHAKVCKLGCYLRTCLSSALQGCESGQKGKMSDQLIEYDSK